MIHQSFPAGVRVVISRYTYGARGVVHLSSTHTLDGVGISRPNSQGGTYPVDIPETSRVCMVKDAHADVRSGDFLDFPDDHHLSGSSWKVEGEVSRMISPLSGWAAGLTFRIERATKPVVT